MLHYTDDGDDFDVEHFSCVQIKFYNCQTQTSILHWLMDQHGLYFVSLQIIQDCHLSYYENVIVVHSRTIRVIFKCLCVCIIKSTCKTCK